jgi:hypothetical protein
MVLLAYFQFLCHHQATHFPTEWAGFFESKWQKLLAGTWQTMMAFAYFYLLFCFSPGQKNFTNLCSQKLSCYLAVNTSNSISETHNVYYFSHCQLNSPNFLMHWEKDWRCRGSNPRPSICETDALPLSYIPLMVETRSCTYFLSALLQWPAYQIRMV